jgi:hypothetical protein
MTPDFGLIRRRAWASAATGSAGHGRQHGQSDFDWSAWKEFHVNAPLNHAPVVTAPDFAASHNQNIAPSALFSVTDGDGDTITKYQFWVE